MKTKLPIPLKFSPRIKGNDYVRVLGTRKVISRFETTKGLNYKNTHGALAEKGKVMPSAGSFMPYFLQVVKANNGELILYDANNKPIPKDEVEELYEKLTTNSWTWLNNYFIEDNRGKLFNQSLLGLKKKQDKRIITFGESPLEQCIMEDCFVDLSFNNQGLATTRSSEQKYKQGKNIKFLYPIKDCVARFDADSYGAYLYCRRDPSGSCEGLGVFEYAEGVPKI